MHGTQNNPVTFMYKNWTIPSLATVYADNSSIDSPNSKRLKDIEITILRNLHHIIDKGRGCDTYWNITTSHFHYCYYRVVLAVTALTAR
jgi:hypothetical protein